MKNNFRLHQSCIDNLETLLKSGNPLSKQLVLAVKEFIQYSPIDFGIIKNGGYRTEEDQMKLFNKNPPVTNCDGHINKSLHQSGLAVDLVPWVDGAYTWDTKHATALSFAFLTFCNIFDFNVISGGDWNGDGNLNESFYDPCHFEIRE